MTTAPLSANHNVTPNDVSQEQDVLLLAGSKISFREVYSQEIDLPLHYGKYYPANDVEHLFVMINGVLTSVSEQAYRNNKALAESREMASGLTTQLNEAQDEATQYKSLFESATQDVKQLQEQVDIMRDQLNNVAEDTSNEIIDDLAQQLSESSHAYTRLLESSSETMTEQNNRISELEADNTALRDKVAELQSQLDNQPEIVQSDTGLQSEYDMLQYKYKKLQATAERRIAELQDNNNMSKELI